MGVTASSHVSLTAVFAVLASAATVGGFVWLISRASVGRARDRWRNQDKVYGYRGSDGHWNPGVIDKVDGWEDGNNSYEGLEDRVQAIEADAHRHDDGTVVHGNER